MTSSWGGEMSSQEDGHSPQDPLTTTGSFRDLSQAERCHGTQASIWHCLPVDPRFTRLEQQDLYFQSPRISFLKACPDFAQWCAEHLTESGSLITHQVSFVAAFSCSHTHPEMYNFKASPALSEPEAREQSTPSPTHIAAPNMSESQRRKAIRTAARVSREMSALASAHRRLRREHRRLLNIALQRPQ